MRLLRNSPPAIRPLRGKTIEGKSVRLREKKLADARNDYNWQSDPELSRFDAVQPLVMPYTLYLLDYTAEIKRPRRNRFPVAIETLEGRHVGNCTCYEIDEKKSEAQLGIMIGDREYLGRGYGRDAVNALVAHVFTTTALERIYLKTLDWNMRAQRCFAACGFRQFSMMSYDGHTFIMMELLRGEWEKNSKS